MTALKIWFSSVACLVAIASPRAQAPVSPYDTNLTGPVEWNLGGTLAIPSGASANRVNVGGGLTVGATFFARPNVGVQLEYGANWTQLHGGLAGSGLTGHGFNQYFDVNAVFRPMHGGRSGLYLLGGGGLYYRNVTVTRYEGTAIAPYCDPFLFYCSAVPVSASSVVGSRSRWDWGLDVGIGYTFGIAPPARVYLEVRYHYIFGPTFTNSSGGSEHADGSFIPITLGVRF
jgi:hypothetical protein